MAVAAIMAPAPVVLGLVGLLGVSLLLGLVLLNLIALIIVVNSCSGSVVSADRDATWGHDRCGGVSGGGDWSVIGDKW